MNVSKSELSFLTFKIAGLGLLFALWIYDGELTGFVLLLSLCLTSLLRWRFPRLKASLVIDCIICIILFGVWGYAHYALILVIFEGLYRRFYFIGLAGIIPVFIFEYFGISSAILMILGALCGLFLSEWEKEYKQKLTDRDAVAGQYYELESLQEDLMIALPRLERMATIAERARISREIHDNAGHEIIAAYISLQTARAMLDAENTDTIELYDAALARLHTGVNKIREAVHNLQTVRPLGAENLFEICNRFPVCPVEFHTYGDTSHIPMYVWNMLESCLNEGLTNVARHSAASVVLVELDATQHLIRLRIENDGVIKTDNTLGIGLRNLRHRASSIGGNLTTDNTGTKFRVVCVIPIQEGLDEIIDS